jgi:tetratricopeptide (TPR) repeat protein
MTPCAKPARTSRMQRYMISNDPKKYHVEQPPSKGALMKHTMQIGGAFLTSAAAIVKGMAMVIAAFLVTFSLPFKSLAAESNPLSPDVEKALLAEDWEKVVTLLKDVTPETQDPVLRMIKGHACLATNRNNESLCFFLSVTKEKGLSEYRKWSENFVMQHKDVSFAIYLKGDALARAKEIDKAIACMDEIITKDQVKAYAYNARGILYSMKNDFRTARMDFEFANEKSNKAVADYYASIGALAIQRKDGAEGALKAFDKAIEINSDFSLALHGRACIKLVLDSLSAAAQDFQVCEKNSACGRIIMVQNRTRIAAYWNGMKEEEFLTMMISGKKTGMSLTGNITGDQSKYDRALQQFNTFTKWAGMPGGQFQFNRHMETLEQLTPQQLDRFKTEVLMPKINSDHALRGTYTGAYNKFSNWQQDKSGSKIFSDILGRSAAPLGVAAGTATENPFIGIATGSAISAASTKTDGWRNTHKEFLKTFNPIATYPDIKTGGVDANLAGTKWENGEWPFVGYFGLCYEIPQLVENFAATQQIEN